MKNKNVSIKESPREEFDRLYKRLEAMSLGLDMQIRVGDFSSEHFHKYRNSMVEIMPRLYELLKELNESLNKLDFYEGLIKSTG